MSADDRATMVDDMTGTAGAVISVVRDKGTDGYFGTVRPADRLNVAFARSAAIAVWFAVGLVAVGLAGAARLQRHEDVREPVAAVA